MLAAKLSTITRFLCGCPTGESACPYCLGLPGALPLPNRAAVDAALDAAKALSCAVSGSVAFLRAPDARAPRGVRIATTPFGEGGALDGSPVARVWLEEAGDGCATLCVETSAPARALDAALSAAGIGANAAKERPEDGLRWHPFPDQPGIRLS